MNTNQDNAKSPQDEMRSKLLIKLIPTVRKKDFNRCEWMKLQNIWI